MRSATSSFRSKVLEQVLRLVHIALMPDELVDGMQMLVVADKLDPPLELVEALDVRRVNAFMQCLLQLLLAHGRAEFYGVAFDH
jgi:hypothetical protein